MDLLRERMMVVAIGLRNRFSLPKPLTKSEFVHYLVDNKHCEIHLIRKCIKWIIFVSIFFYIVSDVF
jgi:hypothetical protein